MKPRSLCALVLALALPALAQNQPQLEPLVPRKPSQPELPPIEPLSRTPRGTVLVGVLVVGALPDGVSSQMVEGPCTNEACWLTAGAAGNVDRVLVATLANRTLRIRVLDVARRKQIAQAQRDGVLSDPLEATAWAEATACKLLVPAGCTGETSVQAPAGTELALDGRALKPGEKRLLPVGVHTLRIKDGGGESTRPLPVLIEGTPPVSIGPAAAPPPVVAAAPAPAAAATGAAAGTTVAAPAAAVTATPVPETGRKWTRTAGYVTAGAAVAAAAVGLYFGAKSRSDLNDAEAAYRANGFYQPADLDKLSSGNSAAHTANALYIASGVLLASAAALTFAF